MTKKEFIEELKNGLCGLPEEDIRRSIEFYSEMIDDRIEDGKTEEDAIADIGAVKDVISQILAEIPISKLIKEKVKKRKRLGAFKTVLLILGSPIWIAWIISIFAVVLSVCLSLWSVVVSLWAAFAAFVGGAFGGIVTGTIFICTGNLFSGLAVIATTLLCAGISIFTFFGCKAATKCMAILTKKTTLGIKRLFY